MRSLSQQERWLRSAQDTRQRAVEAAASGNMQEARRLSGSAALDEWKARASD